MLDLVTHIILYIKPKRKKVIKPYHINFFVLFLFCFCITHAQDHSILIPRSITHNATYELALDNYHIYHHEDDTSAFSFYATPFYTQSNNSSMLARYFLPCDACNLNIQENGSGNVGSLWLNLIAAPGLLYSSTLTIAPVRKAAGSYFYARFDMSRWQPDAHWLLRNLWFMVSFAAFQAKHILNMCETLTGNMTYGTISGITTGVQALNNPTWTAGLFSCAPLKHAGVDDIQLKLGDNWFFSDDQSHIGLYVVGSIPTGNRPNSTYIFEPLVGTKHGAVGAGINGDINLYFCDDAQCNFMLDIKYRYLFSGRERRSFDICGNGDWSRYMLIVNENTTSVSMPAINAATLCVDVTPRSQIEAWCAFHYEIRQWNLEAGYNLWWRDSDKICSDVQLPPNTGIYDIAGAVSGNPVSASQANISQAAIEPNIAPSDAVFTPSTLLNSASGQQPRALVNGIYGAFSYNKNTVRCPFLLGLGGGYEFAHYNTLAQWSVWGKIGLSY
jgi:hypothetical protein